MSVKSTPKFENRFDSVSTVQLSSSGLGVRLQLCNLSAVSIKVVDRLTFPDIRPTAFHVGFHWLDSEDHGNDGNRETKTEDQLIKERCPSGGHPEGR